MLGGKRDGVVWPDDREKRGDRADWEAFRRARARSTGGATVRRVAWAVLAMQVVVVYMLLNPVQQQASVEPTDLSPSLKTDARAWVDSWLATGVLGDDAGVVSWDGSGSSQGTDGRNAVEVETDVFTVRSGSGWWRVEASMGASGPVSYPSATRLAVSDDAQAQETVSWSGTVGSLQPSEALTTLASKWGEALVGYDSDLLAVVVADEPDAAYQAQGLGTASAVDVQSAAYLDRGNVDRNEGVSDMAVMRVRVTLAAKDERSQPTFVSWDVLVSDPDGTPRVLAWGAPGTGASLREHANRLDAGSKPVDVSPDDETGSEG